MVSRHGSQRCRTQWGCRRAAGQRVAHARRCESGLHARRGNRRRRLHRLGDERCLGVRRGGRHRILQCWQRRRPIFVCRRCQRRLPDGDQLQRRRRVWRASRGMGRQQCHRHARGAPRGHRPWPCVPLHLCRWGDERPQRQQQQCRQQRRRRHRRQESARRHRVLTSLCRRPHLYPKLRWGGDGGRLAESGRRALLCRQHLPHAVRYCHVHRRGRRARGVGLLRGRRHEHVGDERLRRRLRTVPLARLRAVAQGEGVPRGGAQQPHARGCARRRFHRRGGRSVGVLPRIVRR
mmetsp:Transcript_26704/g.66900  ORF Transcript_26704/g.66900 Transcript_26704/m.66900 type:complete len:292 (+) Transcript_26704:2800-3675(+)